jgi:hypothetical protein
LFGLFGRLGFPPVGFGSRLSSCLRCLEHGSSAGLVWSIGSSVYFSVGISLRGLWSPTRSVPAVHFLAGPVFGFSFHTGAQTTLLMSVLPQTARFSFELIGFLILVLPA